MKKFLLYLFLITALILPAGIAFGAWGMDIVVTENGTASYDILGCNITANIDYMEADGFIGDNGTDTLVKKAGSAKPHMLVDDRIMFAIPVSGNSTNNLDFTAGNTPVLDYFYTIPGYGGSCNVTDEDSIELGDNFTITQSGWWDTTAYSANASIDRRAIFKEAALSTFISGTEEVTSAIHHATFGAIPGNGIALDYVTADSEWTSIPDHDDFSFVTGGVDEPFSIVAWVYFSDVVDSQAIVAKFNTAAIEWRLFSTDKVSFFCQDPTGAIHRGRTTAANSLDVYEDTWVHIVATYDGTEVVGGFNIYLNGLDADTDDATAGVYTGMTNGVTVVSLGAVNNGTTDKSDCAISEVKVYSGELTPAEALADYNGGHKTADLVAWYEIDEMAGNPADSSGNAHNATANTAGWVRSYNVAITDVTTEEHAITTKGNPAFLGIGEDIGDDTDMPAVSDNLVFNVPLWSTYLEDSPFDSVDANAHTCTVAGATWSYQNGRFFDGTDDEITATSALFAGTNGVDDKTIEFWVYTASTTGLGNMISCRDAGGINWQIYRTTDGAGLSYAATGEACTLAYEYPVGAWTHVALVIFGPLDKLFLYINGVYEEPEFACNFGSDDGGGALNLGSAPAGAGFSDGTFGEIRIYNEILTPTEIEQNYDATKWKYIGDHTDDHFDYVYSGVSVPRNANDYTFYQNNVLPYSDNTSISVNGTLALWFRPTDIIVGTTLPDRATSVANDGTFTFGSNPSGVSIALGAMASDYTATEAPSLATPDVVPILTPPVTTADAAKLAGLADHPLTPAIHAISGVTGIYELLWWWYGTLVLGLLLFGVTYKWLKNLMISGVAFCALVAYGVTIGIYDFWVIFAIIVILLGCVVLQNRRGVA